MPVGLPLQVALPLSTHKNLKIINQSNNDNAIGKPRINTPREISIHLANLDFSTIPKMINTSPIK